MRRGRLLFPLLAPACAAGLLCAMAWNALQIYRDFSGFTQGGLQLEEFGASIEFLDEALTMNARMAVATGDPRWQVRYQIFRGELDALLRDASSLAGDFFAAEAMARTRAAIRGLLEIESLALELAEAGRRGEAAALLESDRYGSLKARYAAGTRDLAKGVERKAEVNLARHRVRTYALAIAGGALALLLGALWFLQRKRASQEAEQRALAEKLLRRSEARHRAVLDSSLDPMVLVDDQGRILAASRSVEAFGWTPAELVGENVKALVAEPHRSRHDVYLAEFRRTGRSEIIGKLREVEATRRDGSIFACELRVSRIDLPDDPSPFFAATLHDLTHRRALECQIRQGQKLEAIGQLAAGIAHEINTPMQYVGDNTRFLGEALVRLGEVLTCCRALIDAAGASGEAAVAAEKLRETWAQAEVDFLLEEMPKALSQSLEGIGRVSAIVRAMKEFSHPGTKEKAEVDLNHALQVTITVARNEWKYVADVETEFDPELPPVPCYAGELNQVFLNLLVNSAHAIREVIRADSPDKGTITVTTRRDGEAVEVRIRDSGAGIPEHVRSRIFEPFFTTKEVGKGTGQGLAIARSVVVDKHGGTIEFETEVGRGTTFIVRLPLTPEPTAHAET